MTPTTIHDHSVDQKIDFDADEFQTNPWPIYHTLRATEPVHFATKARTFLLVKHADVAAALADRRLVADFPMRISRRLFGSTIMDSDGAVHRRLRQSLTPLFGSRRVRQLRTELIAPVVDQVLDRLDGPGDVDFLREVCVPVPYGVITRLLGLPPEDVDWLRERVTVLAGAIDFPAVPLERARAAKAELTDYLIEKMSRRSPLMDLLIRNGGEPTDPDVLSSVILFLLAGTETSVATIGTIMHTLLAQDVRMEALLDSEFRAAAVWETLRLEPPTHSILRYAATDLDIRGVRISRHSAVLLSLASGNRDADVFAEADAWKPNRPQRKTLTFGAGPHTCIGIHLALAEFDVLLERLVTRYQNIRHSGSPAGLRGHGFRGPERLVLTWGSRDA
ncbi:MAG: cytochrome P450 [Kutzneria sp.]|nr:cytochrome P450 [Kutzneria sp.]MBV9845020.1 cytochrome P450 [Kutzneria sp.]